MVPHLVFLYASFPSTPPYMTQHPLLSQKGWREWGSASGGKRAPPTRVRVLGGQAETAGADRQPRSRPGWRGKGKRCMKGVVFIARSGGRNPIRALSWEVTGKTPVGKQTVGPRYRWRSPGFVQQGGFPQGPPSRFHFLFWVFRIVVPHPTPTRRLVVERKAHESYRPGCCRG